ncbi:MAG: UDP-N-acetylmuramate--L-alanine ligase [Bdellovibrionales bacterium CG10_big_fil_rev_8_21_14_0_10_45_34]|nr:MAG: UDP-N-acetylmuramate--L-alanine ligase [Bdellovibrionales bacterium CG10_big_fil_rev_8_21_14_0_10_45_34]
MHFVGIGGIGMSGLAELLHNMGVKVSGSDVSEGAQTARLREVGIPISIGHDRRNVKDADVVVFSSAVKFSNPELVDAKERGIPTIGRAEVLHEVMRLKRGIAVGGTHGKTTTTSLIATMMIQNDLDPTVVVGGRLDLIKSTSKLGEGDWLVAEADESDGSFLQLSPEIAVVTNVDNDHLDHYGSFEALKTAFLKFAERVPFYGLAVVCGDDPLIREIYSDFRKRIVYYGFEAQNDYQLVGSSKSFEVLFQGSKIAQLTAPIPGRHNALNMLAAIAVGRELGIDGQKCADGIAKFGGVDRRMTLLGIKDGVKVIDDYGHHPTEIRATLAAIKEDLGSGKLIVVFQPHRYSRTQTCWQDFLDSFTLADRTFVLPIYSAGEPLIAGITSEALVDSIQKCGKYSVDQVVFSFDSSLAVREAKEIAKQNDTVLFLGAGDIWKVSREFLKV